MTRCLIAFLMAVVSAWSQTSDCVTTFAGQVTTYSPCPFIAQISTASVRNYCYTVDGSTDNSDCIQKALYAIDAGGGGTLYLPRGVYRGSITLPDNGNCVNIIGAGQGLTVLQANSGAAVISKAHASKPMHCTISDLTVDGNLQANGLALQQGKGWTLERIQIKRVLSTTGKGIELGYLGSLSPAFYETRISNVTCEGDSADYKTPGAMPVYCLSLLTGATDNIISELISRDFQIAVEDISSGSNFVSNSHFYGYPTDSYAPTYGIETNGQLYVNGVNFDGFALGGIHAKGRFVSVSGSKFSQPSGSAITTAFPVMADATVDYIAFSDNVALNLGPMSILGVVTPINWNGASQAPANSSVTAFVH